MTPPTTSYDRFGREGTFEGTGDIVVKSEKFRGLATVLDWIIAMVLLAFYLSILTTVGADLHLYKATGFVKEFMALGQRVMVYFEDISIPMYFRTGASLNWAAVYALGVLVLIHVVLRYLLGKLKEMRV